MIFQALLMISSVVILLYLFGALIAHKKKKAKWKEEPFAAGVILPAIRQSYQSKIAFYAFLFLIFDILAFMLVISRGVLYPVLYTSITLIGLIWIGRNVV